MRRFSFAMLCCLSFSACPGILPHAKALAAEPAPVLLHQGERFLRIGNLGFAKANYNKIIENYENSPEAAEAHGDLGVIAARQGDDSRAMAEYEKALAGGFMLAHFNMGQALLRQLDQGGDPALKAKALTHFQAFETYLRGGAPQPPVLVHSMPEVEAELAAALKRLRE